LSYYKISDSYYNDNIVIRNSIQKILVAANQYEAFVALATTKLLRKRFDGFSFIKNFLTM